MALPSIRSAAGRLLQITRECKRPIGPDWSDDHALPDHAPKLHTSTRHESRRVALRPADEIRIEVTTDSGERAAVDYVEIDPAGK